MECDTSESNLETPAEKKMKPNDYAEYDSLVDQLAERLNIVRHPNSTITIKAVRQLVENILSRCDATESREKELSSTKITTSATEDKVSGSKIQQSKFSLNDVSLPSVSSTNIEVDEKSSMSKRKIDKKDEPDEILERAARALKLLYLDDQKELQNQVNEIISSIQSVTANPKTDAKLLDTGR